MKVFSRSSSDKELSTNSPRSNLKYCKNEILNIRLLLSPSLPSHSGILVDRLRQLMNDAGRLEMAVRTKKKKGSFFGLFLDAESIRELTIEIVDLKNRSLDYSKDLKAAQGVTRRASPDPSWTLDFKLTGSDIILVVQGDRPLDTGFSSQVWRAELQSQHQESEVLALKQLLVVPEIGCDKDTVEKVGKQRAYREASIWAELKHRNITPFKGVFKAPWSETPLLACKWAEFGNLYDYLSSNACDRKQIPTLIDDLIDGLTYIHSPHPNAEREFYHGDLHMQNLLVSRRNPGSEELTLWISDYGLSGDAAGTRKVQATDVTGRAYFQSPELFQYRKKLHSQLLQGASRVQEKENSVPERMPLMQKADVFALGVVIFWILTEEYPFSLSPFQYELVCQDYNGESGFLQSYIKTSHSRIDSQLMELLRGCWNSKSSERHSMHDFNTRYLKLPALATGPKP